MNWLGWSLRGLFATLVGCLVGYFAYVGLLDGAGIEAPWLVGVCAGLGSVCFSTDKNGMRGLLVGTFAVWTAAAAQVSRIPVQPGAGIVLGLALFHTTLTLKRFAMFVACALIGIYLGSTSFRVRARQRLLGT